MNSVENDELLAEQRGGALILTLNRPSVGNALSDTLVEALLERTSHAWSCADIHTVVLRGSGRHFCTGFDLSRLDDLSDGDLLLRFVRIETLLASLWHAPKRTMVLAHGRTWGAGADLVAVCERRAIAPGTSFRFPGAQFGLVLGSRRLTERIGIDRARHWILTGHEATSDELISTGLATEIILFEEVDAWLAQCETPAVVDESTTAAIRLATRADHRHTDLAHLVESASRPGLRERIRAYIRSVQR
jgi:enoyl-CoA hydratase